MIKMIVDNGLNQIRDWMCGESATYPLYIGVGTGTTTETISRIQIPTAGFRSHY